MDKSSATAALHCSNPDKPYDHTTVSKRITGRVHVQGTQVQVHAPKEAFRYLGIYITMDLQWRVQYQHMLQLVTKKLASLKRSWLSPKQKMRVLNTSVRPMIRYTFPVAPCTQQQIKTLDSLMTSAAKAAYGLPTCASTAFAHNDVDQGGLGCPSLQVEYHAVLAERLIITLNDHTTTGHITRALTQQQLAQANNDNNPVTKSQTIQKAMRLRQLEALQGVNNNDGLVLIQDGNTLQLDDVKTATRTFLTSL